MAQWLSLVRASPCHGEDRQFKSDRGRHFFASKKIFASVAQSVEQGTENPRVGGSIPPRRTK